MLGWAAQVRAGLIVYDFTAHVTASSFSGIGVGDTVTGSFTYYDDLTGAEIYTESTTYYATDSQPITIAFADGGRSFALASGGSAAAESITNDFRYVLGVSVKEGTNQDDPFANILFNRVGDYGSRALPPTLSLSDFAGAELGYFEGNSFFAGLDTLTPVAAVPEPSTLLSAGTAGLMGLAYAWCRHKAKLAA